MLAPALPRPLDTEAPPHDTCAFAKRDPDYFDFMMDVLDGVRLVP